MFSTILISTNIWYIFYVHMVFWVLVFVFGVFIVIASVFSSANIIIIMSMTTTINTAATAACADVEEAAAVSSMAANGANNSVDSNSNKNNDQPSPLLQSSRLKGYILLLVTASLNFSAAYKLLKKQKKLQEEQENLAKINWCIVLDNLGSFLDFSVLRHVETDASIRYAMAAPLMTVIISCFIILCYFDLCTSLRRTLWPKVINSHEYICLLPCIRKRSDPFFRSLLIQLTLTLCHFNFSDVWS